MKRLWVIGAVLCTLPFTSQVEAAPTSLARVAPQSLCKAGEIEFMNAWIEPDGPGQFGTKVSTSTLSICALQSDWPTIAVRLSDKNRRLLDVSASDWAFEANKSGPGSDISLSVTAENGDSYVVREYQALADSGIAVSRNGAPIAEFALLTMRGNELEGYVGRGLSELLIWVMKSPEN